MKNGKQILIAAAVLIAVLVLGFSLRRGARASDEEQIASVLDQARQGAVSGNAGDILDTISPRYNDGVYTAKTLRPLIIYGMRELSQMQVTMYVRQMQVKGNKANVTLDVQASAVGPDGKHNSYNGPLVLDMEREQARGALSRKSRWRITRVANLQQLENAFE